MITIVRGGGCQTVMIEIIMSINDGQPLNTYRKSGPPRHRNKSDHVRGRSRKRAMGGGVAKICGLMTNT